MEICISFKNVSKKFRIYKEKITTLKDFFTKVKKTEYTDNLVLDDVSFDIYKNQSVGIIGKNGIGKSTILKLITKIIYPDSGEITVFGRVSSLLELGAGFDENFTGRQNIYFNASILGLKKTEVDKVIDKIVEFSGLKDYLDVPVRTYSSGMYMRLAFSVAINVDADILIIDEILAVGDKEFQEKCIKKVNELRKDGKTIIFVSHNMEIIEKVCDRVIWIEDKKIKMDGDTCKVLEKYLESGEK